MHAVGVGHHALGLLDQHSAAECVLELLANDVTLADSAFLQDTDGGDIR